MPGAIPDVDAAPKTGDPVRSVEDVPAPDGHGGPPPSADAGPAPVPHERVEEVGQPLLPSVPAPAPAMEAAEVLPL